MPRTMTDLWHAWRTAGEDAAFETLVRPCLPALYDAARRHGLSADDAEDAVQDALLDLARQRSAKPADVGVGAWLMQAVRFKALTMRRSATRRRRHEMRPRASTESGREAPRLDVTDEVEHALARLPEEDHQVLAFRFLYDLGYREIAYVLGISPNACRIRVHRASTRLRGRLGAKAIAFLAAIPLPEPSASAAWIAFVTQAAAPAAGLGAATLGGVVMGTTAKMALAAVTAAAITSGAFLVSGTDPSRTPGAEQPAPVIRVAAEAPDAPPVLIGTVPKGLADLEPTEEEVLWLEGRLVEERQRLAAARVQKSDSGLQVLRKVFCITPDDPTYT